MKIGNKIKDLRLAKGLKTKELADLIGVDQSTISKIETDKALPSLPTLESLCEVLDVSLQDIFTDPERNLAREVAAPYGLENEAVKVLKGFIKLSEKERQVILDLITLLVARTHSGKNKKSTDVSVLDPDS